MRIVTFGYQTWGCRTLTALLEAGHQVVLAVTHPASDQAYKAMWSDSVEELAQSHGIPTHLTMHADHETIERVKHAEPDVIVVNSWYTRMPRELYELPPHGTLNLHDSLLPKFAGFSPVLWALISGATETGLTVHRMDAGLDSGDILVQRPMPIGPADTAPALVEATMDLIPGALNAALTALENGTAQWVPQDLRQRSYFPRRTPADSLLDWAAPAADLERLIRALGEPYPRAYTYYRGERLEILEARVTTTYFGGAAGRLVVSDGDGMVAVTGPASYTGNNHGLLITRVRTADGSEHTGASYLGRGGRFSDTPEARA